MQMPWKTNLAMLEAPDKEERGCRDCAIYLFVVDVLSEKSEGLYKE